MTMMVKFEELTAQYVRLVLRDVPDGGEITDSNARRQLESALELFLPLMLREADAKYWRLEAFDAFRFPVARKVGPLEVELCGAGLLLSDETWTPVRARLRTASDTDTIAWGSCQVGDRRIEPKMRPSSSSPELNTLLTSVREHPESIEWAFTVEFPAVDRSLQ